MRVHKPKASSSGLLPAVKRGKPVKLIVDGKPVDAYEGETIAAALISTGIRTFRLSPKAKEPRSLYCGMGMCYECLVTVDGVHAVRACVTQVADGMQVETCKELIL
jgi:predicted molibdopterin-dependent oxidoreductase YjgC